MASIWLENAANPGTYFETSSFHQQLNDFSETDLYGFKESIFFIEIGNATGAGSDYILSDGLLSVIDPADSDPSNDTQANFINPFDFTQTNFSPHVKEANLEWWFTQDQITQFKLSDGHSYFSTGNYVVGHVFNNPNDSTPINVLGYEITLTRITQDENQPQGGEKTIFIPFGDQDLSGVNWSDNPDGPANLVYSTSPLTDADLGQPENTDFSAVYGYTYLVYADAFHQHPTTIFSDYIVSGTDQDDMIDTSYLGDLNGDLIDNDDGNPMSPAEGNDDLINAGLGNDTILGGLGNDTLIGNAGSDILTGGSGNDIFVFDNNGHDVITDFGSGNTGQNTDGDRSNNDYVDLSDYYSNQKELHADFLDDGVLNQSTGDFSDNVVMADDASLEIQGITVSDLTFETTNVPCFTAVTLIKSINGPKPIEALQQGELIWTKDAGYQPILWKSHRTFDKDQLAANANIRPVRIAAGALGNGLPKRDLIVSQQHRLILNSKIVERMTNETEVLISAKHLVRIRGINILKHQQYVTYIHIMFDRHHIIEAEGALTESLYTGTEALNALTLEARQEIFTIFPELMNANYASARPARTLLSGRQARKLAQRQIQNKKPLLQSNLR